MPRRQIADPLAASIGERIRALRGRKGMTLEGLAFASEQISKGHLSDVERGLVVPTVGSLRVLAECLEVPLLDLVTFPENSLREKVVELSGRIPEGLLRRWKEEAERTLQDAGTDDSAEDAGEPPRVYEKKPRGGVPLYDLEAIAGALGTGKSVSALGWIRLDTSEARLPGAFVARVSGTSMEPVIPDRSFALFRRPGPGNRNGRTLLLQHREPTAPEDGGSYLLKVFERFRENGQERVRLRSRNPSVAPLVFDPQREELRIVAEFVRRL